MGKLDEFAWTEDGHEGEPQGTKHADLRIIEKPDGTYEAKNLINPTQTVKCDNIEDLTASFESMLHREKVIR